MRKLHRNFVRQPKGEFPIHTLVTTTTHNRRAVHCKVNHEPPRGGAVIKMAPIIKQKRVEEIEIEIPRKHWKTRK
jgi:hypothetical protein